MQKRFTALLIIVCFTLSGSGMSYARTQTPVPSGLSVTPKEIAKIKKKALKAGINSKVRVELGSGEVMEGSIAEITDDKLTLQFMSADQIASRDLDFSTISSLKTGKKPSPGAQGAIGGIAALIIAGVVIGAVTGIAGNR